MLIFKLIVCPINRIRKLFPTTTTTTPTITTITADMLLPITSGEGRDRITRGKCSLDFFGADLTLD